MEWVQKFYLHPPHKGGGGRGEGLKDHKIKRKINSQRVRSLGKGPLHGESMGIFLGLQCKILKIYSF